MAWHTRLVVTLMLMVLGTQFAWSAGIADGIVANIQLGSPATAYPVCDSKQAEGKICRFDCRVDRCRISYQPQFPSWVKMAPTATVDGGMITDVAIETKGYKVQEEVLGLLTAQYGKPKEIKRSTVHNAFGAEYPKIEANWILPWGTVGYEGVHENLESGILYGNLDSVARKRALANASALPPAPATSTPASGASEAERTQVAAASPGLDAQKQAFAAERLTHPRGAKLGVTYIPADSIVGTIAAVPKIGVKVTSVDPNGPAANSGIVVGDVLVAMNGQPIPPTRSGLPDLLQAIPTDVPVTITLLRQDRQLEQAIAFH